MKLPDPTYSNDVEEKINPLLYQREFVKKPTLLTQAGILLAQDSKLFTITRAMMIDAKDNIPLFRTAEYLEQDPLAITRSIRHWLLSRIEYDEITNAGIRPSVVTYEDRKGHCFEKNLLYYAFLKLAEIKPAWIVSKNPIGYKFKDVFDIALHPFLKIKDKGHTYLTDFLSDPIHESNCVGRWPTTAEFSELEMISFLIGEGAESSLQTRNHERAQHEISEALLIDPNNYAHHITQAEIFATQKKKDVKKGRQEFEKAREIAPACADIDKVEGDFIEFYEGNTRQAVSAYKRALEKETKDPLLILDMARRLRQLGYTRIGKKAERKFVEVSKEQYTELYLLKSLEYEKAKHPQNEKASAEAEIKIYREFEPAFELVAPYVRKRIESLEKEISSKR